MDARNQTRPADTVWKPLATNTEYIIIISTSNVSGMSSTECARSNPWQSAQIPGNLFVGSYAEGRMHPIRDVLGRIS